MFSRCRIATSVFAIMLAGLVFLPTGCRRPLGQNSYRPTAIGQTFLHEIEYPDVASVGELGTDELISAPPLTISNFEELESWELTLDECVVMAMSGSRVLQRLGGVVVSSPAAVNTLLDPAAQESNPGQSVEAALSAFDTQFSSSFFFNRGERSFNNLFVGGGAAQLTTNASTFQIQLQKTIANGASFTVSSQTDYNRNTSPANLFPSVYDIVNQVEIRQPLGQGSGTLFNRIAGPNATPGQYNGVLIARLRSDVTLADFEAAVRDLIRDVESNYWELYFAYRDLDIKIRAREFSRTTWENREIRQEGGVGRPDDEAQARQQYFSFDTQVTNALTGVANGQLGVIGAERNLRRLLGLNANDGQVIRPVTEPVSSPISFDWHASQSQALDRRVELRRQKWVVRQRELELLASKQINRWQFDLVGQYGARGFGDNLFGSRSRQNGSAFDDLINGDLDEWQLGVEVGGPIGLRQGHLAVRNAELNLNRERIVLKEQQRQILHDLSASFVEVDRAFVTLKSNVNNRVAVEEELLPKQRRFEAGQDQVFFLLDVQQRLATAESSVHRAIVDYNQALLQYAYNTGSLLSRYNVFLTEGPWRAEAASRSEEKSRRNIELNPNGENQDRRGLIGQGGLDQWATTPLAASTVPDSDNQTEDSKLPLPKTFNQDNKPNLSDLPLNAVQEN